MIKDTRITSKIPGWRQGHYYVHRDPGATKLGAGWNEAFVQEMGEYPNGLTVDLLDAMGYDERLRAPESPHEHMNRLQRRNRSWPYGTQDPVTGY